MRELNQAAERAAIVVERGFQGLGRRSLAKTLGWSEREARSALEYLRQPSTSSTPTPPPVELPETHPTEVSFAKRSEITELTNWSNWERECQPSRRVEETDRKGNPKTIKVIHDPGVAWPPHWRGPRAYADLLISHDAPKKRPMTWGLLVSTQQSHTPVHGPGHMALSAYAGWGGHSLVYLGMETKAPAGGKIDEVAPWSALTEQYVTTAKHDFGNVVIDGEFPMKPSYEDPLKDLGPYCGGRHHVFASMRQDMLTLIRLEGEQAVAQCSGAITVPNYSHSKSGMIAIENHIIGAVVVECDLEGDIHIRNLELDPMTGELWDIDVVVSHGIVRPRKAFEEERDLMRPVINAGCVHAERANADCLRALWAVGGQPNGDIALIDALDPSAQVLHDVFDGHSISPHTRKHPDHQLRKRLAGEDDVAAELKKTANLIEKIGGLRRTTWIVDANHNRHFDRYLLETDWKRDLLNAETFLEVNLARLRAIRSGNESFSALAYAPRRFNRKARFKMSTFADPLRFIRYYYHCHSDRGTNGGPGSVANYVGIGMHFSIAHGHTGRRRGRVHMAGYIGDPGHHAMGPHNRAACVGVEYGNGSYQHILITKGKYRA
ncbi:hypothetical protein AWN88_22500 [Agrobacterium tumefaciens]|nr:hypothetical protein AWN88_22500 [Agrobacterium tumefaciens]KAJ35053.1 hypothetical protein BW45_00240 [Agrobacterium tumefaciens]